MFLSELIKEVGVKVNKLHEWKEQVTIHVWLPGVLSDPITEAI
jgi:hypothetical protein